ncbi:secreted protein [Mycobacterium phage Kratio]|uniref:Membrane protein n=2 Tax=Kratiovirus TaxID=2948788 RepID=A0A385DV10_9CAUD|nr:secreted protein [Mycobacterium phage Kratio]YP_009950665.1 secreted protein [Mycobacterium phage Collard]AJK27375.1 hypothetical protein PBI_KRATIO_46 [Mycobacterium phage Kratio]AXQ63221.1 membrane protein [Mycobacterium phage Collard]UEM46441.1 hypothetical protein SEA_INVICTUSMANEO_47 [Mycobacterium phage InvictusManeo]
MKKRLATVAVAAVAVIVLPSACSLVNQQQHTGCTVTAKDMLYSANDGNMTRTKRVSTSCGSFDVEDSMAGGFTSWDLWASLEVGKSYDLKTGGYRMGWPASTFPVLLEATPRG